MSINRDMRPAVLLHKTTERTSSGALRENWEETKIIRVALYKTSEVSTTSNARYLESTHTGLTYTKEIEPEVDRLLQNGKIYRITSVDTHGRLTNLLLKAVTDHA